MKKIPFGLDINDLSIKLVQLKKKRAEFFHSSKAVSLRYFSEIPVPKGLISRGIVQDESAVVQLIKELIKKTELHRLAQKYVISVLPESSTFIKFLHLPREEKGGNFNYPENRILKEIQKHFPVDVEELSVDWQTIFQLEESIGVLVGAAPKKIVEQYTNLLEKSGLIPIALEIEAVAIARCLLREYKIQENEAAGCIDLGATRTGFIVIDNHSIQCSLSLPLSGERITSRISEKLKISLKEAESLKKNCGLDEKKCKADLKAVLLEDINELAERIQKSIEFYTDNYSQTHPITKIILCGGGSNLININAFLAEQIKLPVEIIQGNWNISEDSKNSMTPEQKRAFVTAIGLALRGVSHPLP